MKRLFFVILFAIATVNSYAQYKDKGYFMADTVKLNATYRELLKHPESKEAQMAYFEAFPNTWMEYIVTYQFVPDDKEGRKNLYSVGHKHMHAFEYKLNLIPDSLYYKKLVNIAIGARKDADAANYLQGCVESHMIDHSEQILNALAPLRKGHRFEFWEFYFSNIIAVETIEEELNRLVELHKDCHPEDVQMMKDAFKYFYNGVNQYSVSYLEAD
ncbi:hypothetical protein [Phocaeicola coprocola]|uniref:hypothetical protein n=1 Tax=Phocaeicola coprocola TaxID=310298 RepID=UPI00266FFB45|nr:hypothetical protein [Phocaeicola coprocola]